MRYDSSELQKFVKAGCKYFLFVVGASEGCDYTMGCNIAFHPLAGNTLEEASKEIVQHLGYDEYRVETALIIEASQASFFDVQKYYADAEKEEAEKRSQIQTDSEKSEYERLKAKFEK